MTERVNYPGTPEGVVRDVDVNVISTSGRPLDRVRWQAILAGIVTALATMFILGVLGAAIGLSLYDRGDEGQIGWGLGIWAIISAIIAFFFGGWLAGRTAAIPGERVGLINGSLVWATTIPLALWFAAGPLGALMRNVTTAGGLGEMNTERVILATEMPGDADRRITVTTPPREEQAERAAAGAWWTLFALLLGLCAAAAGGYVGGMRPYYGDVAYTDRGVRRDVTPPPAPPAP